MGQDTPEVNPEELIVEYNTDKESGEAIELYTLISGRIKEKYIKKLESYDISDPYSEKNFGILRLGRLSKFRRI